MFEDRGAAARPGLINTAADAGRADFLATARAHVAPGAGGRPVLGRGRSWTRAFTCRRLELPALEAALADAGLVFERWCTGDRTWFTAVPA
ncbi:hypothetical protein DMH03_05310 [Amycolatopsis sp. WAC 01376]|uniref:hypothetical protein n=1 Tax=Amycolatopsis sp. WAC 01376 TaxID=2203195 RepID=UPI000F793109|nr:hypothetical protein [Amycolatopsis sp. WAC 01376]RSM66527.1 hypothetical protein DMH03_05310 [Amycolatopsis sp. WAC 01376]